MESDYAPMSIEDDVVEDITHDVRGNQNSLLCGVDIEPTLTPTPTTELTSMKWRKLF